MNYAEVATTCKTANIKVVTIPIVQKPSLHLKYK